MRSIFGRLHRWAGLLTAAFLFFSGVTGAVISWDHELDDLLNSKLKDVTTAGPAKPSIELAGLIEQRDPRARVIHMYMTPEKNESLSFFVLPRIDPTTSKRYTLDYNQIFLDPNTGEELGRRYWGAVWPVTRENFVSFLYKLHYTMHIPEFWGSDRWGMRILGVIAIIWTIDCFIGLLSDTARRANASRREPPRRRARTRQGVLGALEASLDDQDLGQRLPDQFRHPPRLQPVDLGPALHHRVHGVLAEPVFRGVLAADEEVLGLHADALRAA